VSNLCTNLPHRRFVDEDLDLFHLDPGFLRQERHRQFFSTAR
jgi:hypothetical protein